MSFESRKSSRCAIVRVSVGGNHQSLTVTCVCKRVYASRTFERAIQFDVDRVRHETVFEIANKVEVARGDQRESRARLRPSEPEC